jgi:hypothetical protein
MAENCETALFCGIDSLPSCPVVLLPDEKRVRPEHRGDGTTQRCARVRLHIAGDSARPMDGADGSVRRMVDGECERTGWRV